MALVRVAGQHLLSDENTLAWHVLLRQKRSGVLHVVLGRTSQHSRALSYLGMRLRGSGCRGGGRGGARGQVRGEAGDDRDSYRTCWCCMWGGS